jgi:hypothetical protein
MSYVKRFRRKKRNDLRFEDGNESNAAAYFAANRANQIASSFLSMEPASRIESAILASSPVGVAMIFVDVAHW